MLSSSRFQNGSPGSLPVAYSNQIGVEEGGRNQGPGRRAQSGLLAEPEVVHQDAHRLIVDRGEGHLAGDLAPPLALLWAPLEVGVDHRGRLLHVAQLPLRALFRLLQELEKVRHRLVEQPEMVCVTTEDLQVPVVAS